MKKTIVTLIVFFSAAVPGFCGLSGGSTVPEPATELLLGAAIIGFGALAVYRGRKKQN
jgi:hypothetical protein